MAVKKIGLIIGSIRKGSFSKAVGDALVKLAPPELELSAVDISDLPIYNEDLDGGEVPEAWSRLRREIKALDGVIFITPEYNRGLPALLKNALDVGSRPYGASVWGGKPGAIISVTPGSLGAFGANHQLRQSLVFLDVPVMQQPEAYISEVYKLFDDSGEFVPETKAFLKSFLESYAAFAGKFV